MRNGIHFKWALLLLVTSGCRQFTEGSKILDANFGGEPVSGLYAKQIIYGTISKANGITLNGRTQRLQLVTLQRVGAEFKASTVTCGVGSATSSGTELSFPAAFAQNIVPTAFVYRIASNGDKISLTSDQQIEVLGVNLKDPEKEALPTAATDARVTDQDQDGKPGMSVNLKVKVGPFTAGGKVYIVQRAKWSEAATRVSPNAIDGTINASLEQETIGSDSQLLAAVKPTLAAVNEKSSFSMRKLPEGSTCETVVKEAPNLFGALKL